jgi:predicted nucleic acid-binding protein
VSIPFAFVERLQKRGKNDPSYVAVARRATVNRQLTSRELLAAIIDVSDVVWPQPLRTPVVLDDPDDDVVLACAAAGASHIVTGDQHLLALGTWNTIRILTPADYLANPGVAP